ncbi:MAG: hypothetical protein JWN93_2409 [Hyphomicrobiales bacterium]|nr:hypothetical protein [Hyphomicrobiales bacterium]
MARKSALYAALLAACASAPAQADSAADFYRGKEIKLIIGQPVGGGYDTYARMFARHLGRLMAGTPSVIVQNMPGAGGIVMTNSLVAQQPRDGTVIGAAAGSVSTAPLFGAPGARYDARELGWIGSLNSEVGLVVSWKDSPVKKAEDLYARELIVGGSAATDGNVIFPRAMNDILGTKFKVIPGYGGTANVSLAIERGEIQGTGSWHYSSLMAAKPQWLEDGSLNVLIQLALKPHPKVKNAPTVIELAKNDEQRATLELVFAQQDMGRPVYAPPGIPMDRLEALRAAFDAFVRDPAVLREASDIKIEINNPMPGADMAKLVERLYAMPPEAIKRAGDAVLKGG